MMKHWKRQDRVMKEERGVSPALALYSILGFWLFYMALTSLRAQVMGFEAQGEMALRRAVVTAVGIMITWLLYLTIRRFDHKSLPGRIAIAFIAAMPGALASAIVNYYMFNLYDPAGLFPDMADRTVAIAEQGYAFKEVAEVAISRYFFLAAWAALYLALSYAAEARRVERRAARLEQAARQAEMRSLRYQVNPHFLFNTLNSLSSLVMTGRREEAEKMILSLSNFYRTSLTSDPLEDLPLSQEVDLQRLYLAIEAVRFPDRLRTDIAISEDLMDQCVPGLILEPLVENAIKYGVSRASRPVTVAICAWAEDGMMHIAVSDDGDAKAVDPPGGGIGLANVRDRLVARYGDSCFFDARVADHGGFTVQMTLPMTLRRDADRCG